MMCTDSLLHIRNPRCARASDDCVLPMFELKGYGGGEARGGLLHHVSAKRKTNQPPTFRPSLDWDLKRDVAGNISRQTDVTTARGELPYG
eukprot:6375690-Pyramimonas_sp.AAC.1